MWSVSHETAVLPMRRRRLPRARGGSICPRRHGIAYVGGERRRAWYECRSARYKPLGTALPSSEGGGHATKLPPLGTDATIDKEDARVEKMLEGSICRGC